VKGRDFRLEKAAQRRDLYLKVKLGFLDPREKSRGLGAVGPQHRVAKPPRRRADIETDPGKSEKGAAKQACRTGHETPFAKPHSSPRAKAK
jgi:hypothetical protein